VGRRLQAGDGGALSLRVKLLLATVAIVAVSLTLSGALTGYLVQQLELAGARDHLARNALLLSPRIQQLSNCPTRNAAKQCVQATEPEFVASLPGVAEPLNRDGSGERLLVLDRPGVLRGVRRAPLVLYDSASSATLPSPIPLGSAHTVAGVSVREGDAALDGQDYLVAAAPVTARWVSFVVLARPLHAVLSEANGQLMPRVLLAAGAGLLLAVVGSLLLSRAFTRPLHELRRAAEDVAGGNYSRRARVTGRDEIGVVGRAFNGMAEAVERTRSQQRAFLANVSHELKTPLTSLIGFSQALMDGSLRTDAEKLRAATILHEEAQRVLRMSQELLDLARVEAGQIALNLHPVDLGVQLQQELEIVRARAAGRGLTLQLSIPSALPPVRADPDRLHQILENLLDNAVKYAPEGGNVWIAAARQDGGRVTTAVVNHVGPRVPDPDRMFDRFYRTDPSRSSAAGGVGLGLAISRELAMAQGGSLTAELDARGRLCLRLDLPVAPQPPAPRELPDRAPGRLAPRPQPR
jgi:signal transduction histidine kinase